jgi:hypothetical protein
MRTQLMNVSIVDLQIELVNMREAYRRARENRNPAFSPITLQDAILAIERELLRRGQEITTEHKQIGMVSMGYVFNQMTA